ncbi:MULTISPECIES: hypothetical protein [Salipaludibacillus]|uniref:hypothetical protein n=1 Tax=Salipaludibacillus TaxID=1884449 RepID=UPI001603E7BB|nr:hypothetical protein [Salipaludibacillus neizhouensis]
MDIFTILILIVIGIILLKVVGAVFRIVIFIGVILFIVYIFQQLVSSAAVY